MGNWTSGNDAGRTSASSIPPCRRAVASVVFQECDDLRLLGGLSRNAKVDAFENLIKRARSAGKLRDPRPEENFHVRARLGVAIRLADLRQPGAEAGLPRRHGSHDFII